jgi:hypothetical protein
MRVGRTAISALVAIGVALPASAAITFNVTYAASFATDFGGNTAAAQAAILSVLNNYSADFTDPININITFAGNAGTSILGQSNSALDSFTYNQLYNAELADGTSANDTNAAGVGGSLGGNGTPNSGTDPTGGGAFWATTAQAKALQLIADDAVTSDGTITLGAGFNYSFNPGAVGGSQIDFQGVVAHEVSEIMGRIGLSGGTVGATPNSYTLLDVYALTGPGAHAPTFSAGDFFSIDNGTTLLLQFNQNGGGDSRDWQGATNDAFNAFSSLGVANPVSLTDLRELDVLGYDQSPAPEPGTLGMLGTGLLAIGFAAYRRRRA